MPGSLTLALVTVGCLTSIAVEAACAYEADVMLICVGWAEGALPGGVLPLPLLRGLVRFTVVNPSVGALSIVASLLCTGGGLSAAGVLLELVSLVV
jgi:hypothetical protein